jgi:glutathione S-transferase
VLAEKDLDYEIEKVSLKEKQHETPEFLKLNPNGELPVLVDEGFTVYESTAICEYLEDEYPEPPLMPPGSEDRARVRMIEDYCDLHLYRAFGTVAKKALFENAAPVEEERRAALEALERLAGYLGSKKFLVGPFTLADCAVMPLVAWLETVRIAPAELPAKLVDYFDRLRARKGYKGAGYEATTVG